MLEACYWQSGRLPEYISRSLPDWCGHLSGKSINSGNFLLCYFTLFWWPGFWLDSSAYIERCTLKQCLEPADVTKFFPISYFLHWSPSFTLTHFPGWVKVLLCWSWDIKYKCFPKNNDGEVASNSHDSVLKNISGQFARGIIVETHILPMYPIVVFYYCTLCCISDAHLMHLIGVVMLLRFEKKCFVVCFISILKLEANFHNSIWNVWGAQKQLGDTVKNGLCQENEK